jgi:molybdopterin/thiamine biosynthesis adenylyltransferase
MVILPGNIVALIHEGTSTADIPISLVSVDEGDAFVYETLTTECGKGRRKVRGLLRSVGTQGAEPKDMPLGVEVLVVARSTDREATNEEAKGTHLYNAWVRVSEETSLEQRMVKIIDFDKEIFSRIHGLYETDVLQAKTVLILGVGSGGSSIAIELAKAGVGRFILCDHDRLEVANLVRHICGLSDIGRFKTKAVRDQILGKNPSAQVETLEQKIDWDYLPQLRDLVSRADLVFCCTDNRESRMLVNLACISESRICIYGGTLNRAYGGHVLRVVPNVSMCYQCFLDLLPDKANNQEIASQEQANRVAYDDRVVPVEPGLANDIAPIAIMCVKFGILELLRGTETTLASLYEDLSSAWYLWLNRREPGTDYAGLNPLDTEGSEDPRILAWYGVANEREPGCPVCGNFASLQLDGQELTSAEIDVFGPSAQPETSH